MKISPFIYIQFVLVFTGGNLLAQEDITLETAIATGLEKNYSIRIANNDYAIEQNNNTLGNAGFLPTVDLNASKTFQTQDVDLELLSSEGTFSISRSGAKSDRFDASAGVNWTIFDGMQMFITKNKLAEMETSGELSYQIAVQNSVAAIASAYYRIVLEQATYDVLSRNLELSRKRVDFSKNRYELGKGTKADYLTAQVDFNADQTELILQRELLEMARVDLNVLMGQDPNLTYNAIDSMIVNSRLMYDDLEEKVKAMNPQLLLAINEQNVAYSQYKEFVSARYPTIDLGASYGYGTSNNDAGQLRSSQTNGLTYGISASWNIFDGFNKNRQIQNARIQQETTQLLKEQIEIQLLGDLHKRFSNYTHSIAVVELEVSNVLVAMENEKIAIDRYQLGVSTYLDLRLAQRNNVNAQTRLLNAKLVAKLAEIELFRLSGSILENSDL